MLFLLRCTLNNFQMCRPNRLNFCFQRGKRVSKVRVLQRAIDYIHNLQQMIDDCDGVDSGLGHFAANAVDADDSVLFAF